MCKFTTYDGRTPSDGKSSDGLWPGELKRCNKGTSIKVLVLRSNYKIEYGSLSSSLGSILFK
jgi:hypothetical protein